MYPNEWIDEYNIDGLGLVETDPNFPGLLLGANGGAFPKSAVMQSGKRFTVRSKPVSQSNFRANVSRTGLTPTQVKAADAVWWSIYSTQNITTATNTPVYYFNDSPATIAAGNVPNGILPAPQSMIVKELSFAAFGITQGGLKYADFNALGTAVLQITVADKLFHQVPLSKVGISCSFLGSTDTSGNPGNFTPPAYQLPIPIVIPSQSKFSASVTTGGVGTSGTVVTQLILSGEMNRLVV
jgi:hypothetical protein